ncbi:MAG: nucleotidyltransferase family protein [Burkholderiales bacterium]
MPDNQPPPRVARGIVGILLAAGSSRRFGADKLLYPLSDGTPIAVVAARHLVAALPDSIAIVRPESTALEVALAACGLRVLVCPRADEGMGVSLAHAVRATRDADGWVVALADMPFLASATIAAVATRLSAGAAIAAPVVGGQRGHPVGFAHRYRDALEATVGDAGARAILSQEAAAVALVPVNDPGALRDIDTREDLEGAT